MLKQVAEGVLVHESGFIKSNSTVVQGAEGVLLIDPGITSDELAALAQDLRELRNGPLRHSRARLRGAIPGSCAPACVWTARMWKPFATAVCPETRGCGRRLHWTGCPKSTAGSCSGWPNEGRSGMN